MEDVHSLEKKLDNIIFSGLKMYVNIPKYGRVRDAQIVPEAKRTEEKQQKGKEEPSRRHPFPRTTQGSWPGTTDTQLQWEDQVVKTIAVKDHGLRCILTYRQQGTNGSMMRGWED